MLRQRHLDPAYDQERTEQVENPVKALYQRNTGQDHGGTHGPRSHDAPIKYSMLIYCRDAKVRKGRLALPRVPAPPFPGPPAARRNAGARPEIIVAATHGLFVRDARKKLSHPAVREVLVTDTVCVPERDWPQLHVITIAPLIASAMEKLMSDGSLGELY